MKNSAIGILSLCFGILGFFTAYWYIGIILCIIAVFLGIVGLMDYLAYKWSSVLGLIFSGLGAALFTYTIVTDINDGRLIIAYERGDFAYVTNIDEADETWNRFADILADAELKAMQDNEGNAEQNQSTALPVANEVSRRNPSAENTVVVDRTSSGGDSAGTDDPGEAASDSYVKGTNYGNYWESQWLGMRYDQPDGYRLFSDSELNDALQIGDSLLDGTFGEGMADAAGQNSVYEMMAAAPSGTPNFNLGVEKTDASIDEYAGQLGAYLPAFFGDAYIGQSGFEGTQEIGGRYFEKYTFYVDDGASGMNQTYYITKKDDRMVFVIMTYSAGNPGEADTLLSGFSEL